MLLPATCRSSHRLNLQITSKFCCRFEEAGPRAGSTRASRGSSNLATLLDSTWQEQQERLAAVSAADPPAPPHGSARATLGSPNLASLLDTNWQGQLEQLVRGRTEALQADSTARTAGAQSQDCRRTALDHCGGKSGVVQAQSADLIRRSTKDVQANSSGRLLEKN